VAGAEAVEDQQTENDMTSEIDLDMATDIVGEPVTADNTSRDLLAALGDDLDGWVVASLPYMRPDGFRDHSSLQVVYNDFAGRAGLTVTGSGSSGHTTWTDASSLADAFRRCVEDDMTE